MVRSARGAIAFCLGAWLLVPAGESCAQPLARLHVDALGMHADRSSAPVGAAVHVTIHLHVRERLATVDNLVLPDLSNLEIIGDERRVHTDSSGTDYVETLSVTGITAGAAHLTPAHLDAIDARNGKPTRFSSNDLTLRIGSQAPLPNPFAVAMRIVWRAFLMSAGIVAGIAVLIGLIRLRHKRERPPVARAVPQAVQLPPVDPRADLKRAVLALRAESTRIRALETRAALRRCAGASAGETLAALLLRLDADETALRAALRLAERAAFVADERLQGSIEEFLAAAERVAAR
jgi:hypothetical protein